MSLAHNFYIECINRCLLLEILRLRPPRRANCAQCGDTALAAVSRLGGAIKCACATHLVTTNRKSCTTAPLCPIVGTRLRREPRRLRWRGFGGRRRRVCRFAASFLGCPFPLIIIETIIRNITVS